MRNGLVQELVEAEALRPRAREIAEKILECAPLAVEAIKRTVWHDVQRDVEESYAFAKPLADRVARSEDAREGTRDFSLGRKTGWKGR